MKKTTQQKYRTAANKQNYKKYENKKDSTEFSRQFISLLVCVLLFTAVFIGRGVFPEGVARVQNQILTLLAFNTDFQAIFHEIGESIHGGKTIFQQADELYKFVFGIDSHEDVPDIVPQLTSLWVEERGFLNSAPELKARTSHYTMNPYIQLVGYYDETDHQKTLDKGDESGAVPAIGSVLFCANYSGPSLPEGYTMDHISLGELDTKTPLMGKINSVYGYRDHPIDGRYQFHGGVDIGGQKGDTIGAFADGTVEYIGEDNSYGLYIQLDHGDGVKSFYAHCDSVCVKKGQGVLKGEKIGEVGSSGAATGPHLHLELKYNNLHLDPGYYIECLSAQ